MPAKRGVRTGFFLGTPPAREAAHGHLRSYSHEYPVGISNHDDPKAIMSATPLSSSAPKRGKGRRRSSQEDAGGTEDKTYRGMKHMIDGLIDLQQTPAI